ncbi:MAG: hypothetical protein F4Y82_00020 [Cenarchaeum sp. SB0665_bin_23]|nr:hypothetical protein [Cenarchaeum sp. SB0665_bin_23]MYG33150.1 hypothetical protein [Cenarchaeum sp. SB0677_bin_16]
MTRRSSESNEPDVPYKDELFVLHTLLIAVSTRISAKYGDESYRYGFASWVEDIHHVKIPVLEKKAMTKLVRTYDRYCDKNLDLLRNPNKIRVALDKAVCDTLGLDQAIVSTMRTELSREPMVTGKRYGERPTMMDRYE